MALVLIVDDFRPITAAVSALVASMGHHAVAAQNAADALQFLRRRAADLIVLDLSMPVMSGLDLLRQLRADATLSRLPVVIFSVSEDLCDQAATVGVTACVLKPDVETLSRELRRLLPDTVVHASPPPQGPINRMRRRSKGHPFASTRIPALPCRFAVSRRG